MRKQDVTYTLINIVLAHLLISVFAGLAFGVTHPLSSLYSEGSPYLFVLVSLLMMIPVYAGAGYLFILGKNSLRQMDKSLGEACLYFALGMLAIYALCLILVHYKVISNAWVYYVILNYPNALIFNNITLKVDGQNLIFALTALTGALGFYAGGMIRYKYEKVKVKE
ncbi:hypothetical protein SDC9_92993 [bioreactor metagenome]|uniref:Uncharacterized protein n=1 Tax=bioreactor metagenome TaxID=1076179 RepID=A0A644ZZA2_9ZZZZ